MTPVDDVLWSAVADPSRRRVLDLVFQLDDATASSLAGHVPFSRQAVAKHLAVLEDSGLISRRKQGREVRYEIEPVRLAEIARAMSELAGRWDRRLADVKRLAEAAYAESVLVEERK